MTTRLGPDLVEIMEGLPVGVFRTSVDGEILAVNEALANLLGYAEPAEALGLDARSFYVDPAQREIGMSGLRQSGETHSLEFTLRRRDGDIVWVRESARAVYGLNGAVLFYEGVLEDITDVRRAHRELRQSEEMFRSAFEEAPIGMSIGHPDLIPIRVNAAFTRITGYTESEARTLTLGRLVHPDSYGDADHRRREMSSVVVEPYRAERLLRHKDGHRVHVLLGVSPVYDSAGELLAVLSQFVDISEQRKAQEAAAAAEAQNRALLDAIPDLLFRLDRDGIFLGARYSKPLHPDPVGRSVGEVFPDLAERAMVALEASFTSGETQEVRLPTQTATAEQRTYEARITAIDETEAVAIVRNVTDQLAREEALSRLIKAKDEFVAAVSHELRTPLTTVVGLALELRDRLTDLDPTEAGDMVDLLADQSQEMADLVEDLLVAARSDLGRLTVDIGEVELRTEASSVLHALPVGTATLEPSTEIHALGDPVRIRQVIRNLVTNAMRYGGVDIRVLVTAGEGRAYLEVRDDGEGIPGDEQERIFEPYYRGTPSRPVPAAVGIGLSVSRDLARRMRGDLTYSRRRSDSVFTLELPAR